MRIDRDHRSAWGFISPEVDAHADGLLPRAIDGMIGVAPLRLPSAFAKRLVDLGAIQLGSATRRAEGTPPPHLRASTFLYCNQFRRQYSACRVRLQMRLQIRASCVAVAAVVVVPK